MPALYHLAQTAVNAVRGTGGQRSPPATRIHTLSRRNR